MAAMALHGQSELIENSYVQAYDEIVNNTAFIQENNQLMFALLDNLFK
ncbi:hypothetical protein [Flavobacterium sp. ZB4R12]